MAHPIIILVFLFVILATCLVEALAKSGMRGSRIAWKESREIKNCFYCYVVKIILFEKSFITGSPHSTLCQGFDETSREDDEGIKINIDIEFFIFPNLFSHINQVYEGPCRGLLVYTLRLL